MIQRIAVYFFTMVLSIATMAQVTSPDEVSDESTTVTSPSKASYQDKYYNLWDKKNYKAKRVMNLYVIEKKVLSDYGGGSEMVWEIRKKNIHKAGGVLIEDYTEQLESLNEEDWQAKVEILTKMIAVYTRLEKLSSQEDTRPLEKSLKKLKTTEEITPVLFSN